MYGREVEVLYPGSSIQRAARGGEEHNVIAVLYKFKITIM
jgi:hypothetical protein